VTFPPVGKLLKLVGPQLFDSGFDFDDRTHAGNLAAIVQPKKRQFLPCFRRSLAG
jgi:hypothetical protein